MGGIAAISIVLTLAVLFCVGTAHAQPARDPVPYRFLVVINDQWSDPASEVIEGASEFSMLCALLKTWGVPFDIYRLDQQRFDAYHLLDRAGRPLHGTIIWDAPGAALPDDAVALLRTLVREHGVGVVALGDAVETPVVAALAGLESKAGYVSEDPLTAGAGEHFITRGVAVGREHAPVRSKLLRNPWIAADKPARRGHEVTPGGRAVVAVRRGARPWLTACAAPAGGRATWIDLDRATGELGRPPVRELFKRSLVWTQGYAVYAEYGRAVMLSMDDMGASDKTFYPGWHYPTLSEAIIREHIIAPLQRHGAVMVENIVTGFVDRASRRILNPWRRTVTDELDPAVIHDFASTKRGLDAGVKAGVFEIQCHGWTHMPPDLDSPPGPFWPAAARSPVVELNWYKEFGDIIRKAEVPAIVQRLHLQRAIAGLEEDFGTRPLSLVCGGGLSSHSAANNTMRLAATLGFGFAQPESVYYVGRDLCAPLEPVVPRLQWNYTAAVESAEVPWTNDAPVFLGLHDRDVAMAPASFARLLDGLGKGVRFMTFAEYCGYLHAGIARVPSRGADGLAFAFDYDPHYGAFFARHASRWTLHVSDETRQTLHLSREKQTLEIPPGATRHVIQAR